MKKMFMMLLLALPLLALNLELKSGYVAAHTEMLMDKTIDPTNNYLNASITIQNNDITTIKGKFWVEITLFTSDKGDRDKSMYEELQTDKFKLATYTITNVTKADAEDSYTINGILDFHGEKKELSANAKITTVEGSLTIDASSMILMSDYGIKMPCMIFMCVRDQVDLLIKATF
ncbi:YceI family protein [Sulfurimonas sp.]|uniref:YceI family protein n=1 Tax=Sulfurimonas sp. TaxID=2022749 RepID=UPI0025E80172|nr:YceI family protein [Sulfurimonas sp.]MCK9472745.1 YceI family protein [Sulfurimonas sp.]MDD3505439.1 YceI family protein [Sulfurimonas sp.]